MFLLNNELVEVMLLEFHMVVPVGPVSQYSTDPISPPPPPVYVPVIQPIPMGLLERKDK